MLHCKNMSGLRRSRAIHLVKASPLLLVALVASGCFGRSGLEDEGTGGGFGLAPLGGSSNGGSGAGGTSGSGGTAGVGGTFVGGAGGTLDTGGFGGVFGTGGFDTGGFGGVFGTGGFDTGGFGGVFNTGGFDTGGFGGTLNTGGFIGTGGFITGGFGGVIGTGGFITGGFGGTLSTGGSGGTSSTGGVTSTGGAGGVAGSGGTQATGGTGPDGGASCGASTCAGCCDAAGACLSGTNANSCGSSGVSCTDCGSSGFGCDNGICQGTAPKCGPSNCTGCCDTLGRCRLGTEVDACGVKGASCSSCSAKKLDCEDGVCAGAPPTCGASSCGGCCDAKGVCQGGTTDAVCGADGAACANCSTNGKKCNEPGSYCAFLPSCSELTCPTGCCDSAGVCRDGRSDTACGASADACTNCTTSSDHCSASGFCYTGPHCGPDNCGGCCAANGTCRAGDAAASCGRFGAQCESCTAAGQTCQSGACGVTGATCPAPYAGCNPGSLTPPPAQSTSCTSGDLATIAGACPGKTAGTKCTAEIQSLVMSNPGCFDCMQQFLFDGAVVRCLAPFLSATCNHDLSCSTDCTNTACGQCAAADQGTCDKDAFQSGGECQAYVSGTFCAQAAFSGPGAFCNLAADSSIGVWLETVGAYYCSP